MEQNALQVVTRSAAAQLAVWDYISPFRPRPAREFFGDPDVLNLVLPKSVGVSQPTLKQIILGYLGLFSACKGTRVFVSLLVDGLKRLFVGSDVRVISPFCWTLMEGRSVGEYMMLFRNYMERGPQRYVHFRETIPPVLTAVSRIAAVDLGRPINGFAMGIAVCWRLPLSVTAAAFAAVVERYQHDGDMSEFHKFGFFSSFSNRRCFESMLWIIEGPPLRGMFVHCPHRLTILKQAIDHSFGVVDLTPPLLGIAAGEEFTYLPQLTGLHVGINPRDIADFNAYSRGRGPEVSFDLVGAPLH